MWLNKEILYETDFFLKGNLGELERLAEEVSRFRAVHSLSEEVEFALNLALEELFVNSVRHGGCEGLENSTRVRLGWEGGLVAVEFHDRGRPFDLTRASEPDTLAPLEERRAGGLGIHLVRSFMRDVEYRRAGEWNQVTMKCPGCAAKAEEPEKDLASR
jgi:serine/threonine-protein kinase RsbW